MLTFIASAILIGLLGFPGCAAPAIQGTRSAVTFNRDIAPLIFEHCSGCHHRGQPVPFNLLDYRDATNHARTIAAVVKSRTMPPWPPESGYGEFINQRRLQHEQIDLFEEWVQQGMVEGDPRDLPTVPTWPAGWQLGTPDLVVDMPQPYTMQADGGETFRNFVLPVRLASTQYVRGVEFLPVNSNAVHHAVIDIDRTRSSRRLDDDDPEPGFDGMLLEGAQSPDGHFLGWTPGATPSMIPDGMAWRLEKGTDLVLQLHMLPTGKREVIQPRVGLFFTSTAPSRVPFLIKLGSKTIDIPEGKPDYEITDTYALPVDVEAMSVYPHAHYLAKDMKVFATLPNGTLRWLLWIKDWNFKWQDQYRYATPILLPKGTVLTMHYLYDNSAHNVRNPHHPPKRVTWGPQSSDEMGDLWLQVLPRNRADWSILARDSVEQELRADIAGAEQMVRITPRNAGRRDFLGARYLQAGRVEDAITQLEEALRISPQLAEAHNNLANALLLQGRVAEAIRHFRHAVRVRPKDGRVHFNLANALKAAGRLNEAIRHFRRTIALDPDFADAHNNLGAALGSQGKLEEAILHFQETLKIDPDYADAHSNLGIVLGATGKLNEAIFHFRKALEIRPDHADARKNLQLVLNSPRNSTGRGSATEDQVSLPSAEAQAPSIRR